MGVSGTRRDHRKTPRCRNTDAVLDRVESATLLSDVLAQAGDAPAFCGTLSYDRSFDLLEFLRCDVRGTAWGNTGDEAAYAGVFVSILPVLDFAVAAATLVCRVAEIADTVVRLEHKQTFPDGGVSGTAQGTVYLGYLACGTHDV